MAVRPLGDSKLAGQSSSSPSLISTASRGVITLGKRTDNNNNNNNNYTSSYYNDDQENQIPALHPVNANNNKSICDLTKEESLDSTTSSTTEMLKDIEKSHESELCHIDSDDNQRILILETNYSFKLCDNFHSSFMQPSHIGFFPWNWWNIDVNLIKYYKNDITFHGPNLYLSGPIYNNNIYPLLRPLNFDTIDFEYPLKYITCHLSRNEYDISLMTDIVNDSIQEDINNNNNINNINRIIQSDEELEKDIKELNIKWSVSGTFISKPYENQSMYHSDSSFDIGLHFNWNIDCIENDCQYNVYIFPSHIKNRHNTKEIQIYENDYHSIHQSIDENNNQNISQYTLTIYPLNTNTNINNINNININSRKRNRNDMDINDMNDLNIMPSINNNNHNHNKKRKLNDGNVEEKQEYECKNNININENNQPLQKRFKNKSSNRKKRNKTIQRNGRNVSVTVDKKVKKKENKKDRNNSNNNSNNNNNNNNNNNGENVIDYNGKYRGYFIAIFVPRSSELYPFCTESMNLQPFIRGQIIFYDSISVDKGKPDKDNYKWLIENIIKTYKKKGKNLNEFTIMKHEYDQYINNLRSHTTFNNYNEYSTSGSIVFDNDNNSNNNNNISSKREQDDIVDLAASSTSPQPADSDVQ